MLNRSPNGQMIQNDRERAKLCCAPARETSCSTKSELPKQGEQGHFVAVDIPGGSATIGTDHPILAVDGEAPQRIRRIKPFRLDATAVTNARFARFVADTGYQTEAERLGDSFVFAGFLDGQARQAPTVPGTPWWHIVKGANWRAIFGPGSEDSLQEDHPVVHVSWNDARTFAQWAGGRLPTEAEWEHAARGGLGDVPFPWGNAEPNDVDHFPCNIWQGHFPNADEGRDGYVGTAPAQSFEPNAYGLYNMVGNVWEWTSQPFKVRSLKKRTQRIHGGKAGFKTIKGGSFLCHKSYCYRYRIAARNGTSPDSSMSHQGFRLAYAADSAPSPRPN